MLGRTLGGKANVLLFIAFLSALGAKAYWAAALIFLHWVWS